MPVATHNPNIGIDINLATRPVQRAGFSKVLLLVDKATNSLNGSRMVTYTNADDAQTGNTAGYISASTLARIQTAFAQSNPPDEFKVGYVDLSTSVAGVKASKDFGDVGTGAFDTVLEAHTAGEDGNDYTVELVGDSATTVSITIDGTAIQIHVKPGTSTVGDVETAIAALSGANDVIDVKTGGTGATVLAVADCNMGATHLAGGVDAVPVETYSTALAACQAFDPDFYGVCIDSRTSSVIAALATTIEASSQRMLFVFQNGDSSWLDSGVPSEYSTAAASYERTIGVYHDTATEYADIAYLVDRLAADPDEKSAPWHYAPLSNVDDYAADMTAAQRLLAIANNINVGLPFGGSDFVIDPGKNISGRPVYEVVTADWFEARVREDISELAVAHSARHEKIILDAIGQAKVQSVINARLAQGEQAGHFAVGQTSCVAETITAADRAAQRMRFTVRAQDAVAARLFNFNVYFSRDPISTPVTA